MYNIKIKDLVKKIRRNGTSINEIAKKFSMNKSTISYWCRDIKLEESAIRKIKTKGREKSVQGLLRYSEVKRQERIDRTLIYKNIGAQFLGSLSERDIILAGLGLYWGEGYKESNGELGFTNSDSKIIYFYIQWLKLWKVQKTDLIFRLTINNVFKNHQHRIKKFWIDFLEVKDDQFSKTTIIKTNLKKANIKRNNTYKGILRVKVKRGLSLKNKILGAIDHISTQL